MIGGTTSDYHKLSPYPRSVKYRTPDEGIIKIFKFRVLHVQHILSRKTYSFLPSFAVPYKHYGSDIIFEVIEHVYTTTDNVYETAAQFCIPYHTIRNWVNSLTNNFRVHLTEGSIRLNISLHGIDSPGSLVRYYSEKYSYNSGLEEYDIHIYQLIQIKFTQQQPSIGFFRPLLI